MPRMLATCSSDCQDSSPRKPPRSGQHLPGVWRRHLDRLARGCRSQGRSTQNRLGTSRRDHRCGRWLAASPRSVTPCGRLAMEKPSWSQLSLGFGVAVAGIGMAAVSGEEIRLGGILLGLAGVLLMITSLRAPVASTRLGRSVRRQIQAAIRNARQKKAARKLRPILDAFDRFRDAAGAVVVAHDELRDGKASDTSTLYEATARALALCDEIEPRFQPQARKLLRALGKTTADDPEETHLVRMMLHDWLMERFRDYFSLRKRAGLPSIPRRDR